MLDKVHAGLSYASVGHMFSVNESTTRYINKNKKAIHKALTASAPARAKAIHQVRVKAIKMERALSIWIEDRH